MNLSITEAYPDEKWLAIPVVGDKAHQLRMVEQFTQCDKADNAWSSQRGQVFWGYMAHCFQHGADEVHSWLPFYTHEITAILAEVRYRRQIVIQTASPEKSWGFDLETWNRLETQIRRELKNRRVFDMIGLDKAILDLGEDTTREHLISAIGKALSITML